MLAPELHPQEEARLRHLHAMRLLDTPVEERFERLTRLAQHLTGVPIAAVSLIDADRQWFKSQQGLGVSETARSISFCGHAILGHGPFVVPDATADPRFMDNPLVVGAPHLRAYAGLPLAGPEGLPVGTLCAIDTQSRHFTREELSALEDLAALATRELFQVELAAGFEAQEALIEALRQATKAAQAASHAKGDFLASMSHELRTPLNAIIGYAEILQEDLAGEGKPDQASDAARIVQAGRHLRGLIDQVLDLAKVEAGRMELRPEWCHPGQLAQECLDVVRPLALGRGNRLQADWPQAWPACRIDPLRFKQILLNLLGNAAKFTQGGQIQLRGRMEPGEDWLRWEVQDDGPGIPPELLPKLFEAYAQGEEAGSSGQGSTGLGLGLAKRLAERMGGELEALPAPAGGGAHFRLRLPLTPPPSP